MYAHFYFYCWGAPVAIVVRPPSASRLPLPAPSAYPVRLPLPLGLCVCVLLRSAVAVVLSVQRLLLFRARATQHGPTLQFFISQ